MKSGGQIEGQMSSQSPVDLWYREVNCEVPVLSAESADSLFSWCDLRILSEGHIRHIPWFIGYHAQDFHLETFQYFDVGDGGWALELYSVGPDGFEDDFIGWKFVAYRKSGLRPSSQYILKCDAKILLLSMCSAQLIEDWFKFCCVQRSFREGLNILHIYRCCKCRKKDGTQRNILLTCVSFITSNYIQCSIIFGVYHWQ
jgi:hypothetical protein